MIQGDRLNIALFYTLYEMACPVYDTVQCIRVQVTFSKIPEKTRPCLTGHPVIQI